MALKEKDLNRELDKHHDDCELCQEGSYCRSAENIEAQFWNEVDREIDEAKDREYGFYD